jgi:hypothetical protein
VTTAFHAVGRHTNMTETDISMKNVGEKLSQLEAKTLELRFLTRVTMDLRSYRKMIGVKNYD